MQCGEDGFPFNSQFEETTTVAAPITEAKASPRQRCEMQRRCGVVDQIYKERKYSAP
jgi:hypothetical protein